MQYLLKIYYAYYCITYKFDSIDLENIDRIILDCRKIIQDNPMGIETYYLTQAKPIRYIVFSKVDKDAHCVSVYDNVIN